MNQQTCNRTWLDAFLKNDLNELEEQMLTLHLDECSDCREELEGRAAEQSVWQEASNLLGGSILLSTAAIGDRRSGTVHSPQIALVLQQLAPTDDPESLGRIGGYEVTGVVGAGGMGVVLKAHDRSLDRIVAIKVMAPHLASSGSARKRFAREAKAAAAVLHPNVIAIHSVASEDANPYLVMAFVRGASLQKRIDSQGPLPLKDTLRIGAQIAAGLAAAHEQGLVHRDIKPANILLEEGVERVTITDFGLARAVDDASMTCSGVIAGTPQYMSPEQARGEPIDARSDLFSLGGVLYAMCTGRSPFRAETTYGVLHRIANDKPTPVCEINTDVPVWLGYVIERLIAKRPEDRFESAAHVAELLEGCLAHVQQPMAMSLPEAVAALVPTRTRRPPVRKFIASAAGLFGLLFAGILIVLELGKGTLTIESEMDDVPIRITQNDKIVEQLTVSKSGTSVRVAAGTYVVELETKLDGMVLENDQVSLKRGKTEQVKIRYSKMAKDANDDSSSLRFETPEELMKHIADCQMKDDGPGVMACYTDQPFKDLVPSYLLTSIMELQYSENMPPSKPRYLEELVELKQILAEEFEGNEAGKTLLALILAHKEIADRSVDKFAEAAESTAESPLVQLLAIGSVDVINARSLIMKLAALHDKYEAPDAKREHKVYTYTIEQDGDKAVASEVTSKHKYGLIKTDAGWRINDIFYGLKDRDGSDLVVPKTRESATKNSGPGSDIALAIVQDPSGLMDQENLATGKLSTRRNSIAKALAQIPNVRWEEEPTSVAGEAVAGHSEIVPAAIDQERASNAVKRVMQYLMAVQEKDSETINSIWKGLVKHEKRENDIATLLTGGGIPKHYKTWFVNQTAVVALGPVSSSDKQMNGRFLLFTLSLVDERWSIVDIDLESKESLLDRFKPSQVNAVDTAPLMEQAVPNLLTTWEEVEARIASIVKERTAIENADVDFKLDTTGSHISRRRYHVWLNDLKRRSDCRGMSSDATEDYTTIITPTFDWFDDHKDKSKSQLNARDPNDPVGWGTLGCVVDIRKVGLINWSIESIDTHDFDEDLLPKDRTEVTVETGHSEGSPITIVKHLRKTAGVDESWTEYWLSPMQGNYPSYIANGWTDSDGKYVVSQHTQWKRIDGIWFPISVKHRYQCEQTKTDDTGTFELVKAHFNVRPFPDVFDPLDDRAERGNPSNARSHDGEPPANGAATTHEAYRAMEKLLTNLKMDWQTTERSIASVASRMTIDTEFAKDVLDHFKSACAGGESTYQARRHLLASLTIVFRNWGQSRWSADTESIELKKMDSKTRPVSLLDIREIESSALKHVVNYGRKATRSDIVDFVMAARAIHHPDAKPFLRDVFLNPPMPSTSPYAPPANTPTPSDQSVWRDNFGGTWPDARFVAAVGLAEFGDQDAIEWLVAKAKPNDFGLDESINQSRHMRDRSGSLRESSRCALTDLFGQPEDSTEIQLSQWWTLNKSQFTPRVVRLKPDVEIKTVTPREKNLGNARSVVEAYVAAAITGDVAKAASLAKNSPADPKRIQELPVLLNVQRLKIETVYINDPVKTTRALATSVAVKLDKEHKNPDGQREGYLVFMLEFANDQWFVIDIDFEKESGAEKELNKFLKANPNSIGIPPQS